MLGGGLTLKRGVQRDRYMAFLSVHYPHVVGLYSRLYGDDSETAGSYGPELLRRVREICTEHSIPDRMARPILPTDPLGTNKRIAERLFLKAYALTLEEAASYRVWAYRKAAWAIDELEENVESIYAHDGSKGVADHQGYWAQPGYADRRVVARQRVVLGKGCP